ncbi:MAG: GNAT family N-acetyltransferase [Candidatus Eremiobacteraeota bacterium]|nr:GNAT family N-acetyltransferase [Candidatus Eremiobacteraeota bacterium]
MRRASWAIRPKGERDAAGVAALLAEISREGRWIATEWPFDVDERARQMRDGLLRRWCVGWVATDGRDLIGDLTVFDIERDDPELGMVVAATHRRRGIGRALLACAFEWAHANGKSALTLRVFPDNDAARELYRTSGFVDVDVQRGAIPRRDGPALDAILMRRWTTQR